jgi:PAS domain-containing protein
MSLFRSQVPNIIDRLKELRRELECAQKDIERLDNLERRLEVQKNSKFRYEEILKSALDTFGVALWIKDINSHFLFVNQVCCETILRCTIDDALLKTDADFKNDALAKICHISDKKVIESQKTRRFIEHAVYADGESVTEMRL